MRTFCNSFLAALIITALFWGNCFSCPQILLAAKHSCCHKTGQVSIGCQTQVLKHFVKAEVASPAPPVVAGILPVPMPVVVSDAHVFVPVASEHAPPDILSFRI
jgi:hypothetical protein